MILHVTFSDGSNPWLSLPADRHTIAKLWRRWMKNHPRTARPVAHSGDYRCHAGHYGGYYVLADGKQYFDPGARYYKTLGHALATLEKLGGN